MRRTLSLASLAFAATCGGCAHLSVDEPPATEAMTPPSAIEIAQVKPRIDTPSTRLLYHMMAGELAEGRGMPGVAAREFRQVLAARPDAQLAARTTALSLAANDMDLAVESAETWQSIDPDELSANEVLARLYLRQDRIDDVLRQSRPLIEAHPGGRGEGFRALALLLSQEPKNAGSALKVLQTLADENENDPAAYYAVGLIAVRYDELGLAEQSARRALEIDPAHKEAILLLAGVQVRQGETEQADKTLNQALRDNPNAAELRVGYAKLLLETDQIGRAREQLELALQSERNNADALYALSLIELDQRNIDAARGHLQHLINSGQRRDEAAYYLGRIAEVDKQPQKALEWYSKVEGGPQGLDAVMRIAAVEAQIGQIDEARSQLERLRRAYPQLSTRLYSAEGEILYTSEEYPAALEMYEQALDEHPDDADLLYGRSLVYEQLGNIGAAEADLRRIVSLDPEDARALNALGYMLTTHTQRFQEALGLIKRAAELTPNDAAVIDSLGWVHYRLGDLQQAHDYLQRAFDHMRDPEIAAHLGEVLWQMGRQSEARQVWETALRDDPDHPVLRETVGRLAR
ncbi:MAG: tetratricopeptide repeat protein [Gammaproteobacteria bacterium]|nr:tetratricopeptide repeat protein [Gammaproteobacteria bacterium]